MKFRSIREFVGKIFRKMGTDHSVMIILITGIIVNRTVVLDSKNK